MLRIEWNAVRSPLHRRQKTGHEYSSGQCCFYILCVLCFCWHHGILQLKMTQQNLSGIPVPTGWVEHLVIQDTMDCQEGMVKKGRMEKKVKEDSQVFLGKKEKLESTDPQEQRARGDFQEPEGRWGRAHSYNVQLLVWD